MNTDHTFCLFLWHSRYMIAIVDALCIAIVILMYIAIRHMLNKTRSKLREAIRRFPDFGADSLTLTSAGDNQYSFRAAIRNVQHYFLAQVDQVSRTGFPDRFCLFIMIHTFYFQQLSAINKMIQGNELQFFVQIFPNEL